MSTESTLRDVSKRTFTRYIIIVMCVVSVSLIAIVVSNTYKNHNEQIKFWMDNMPSTLLPHLIDSDYFSISGKLKLLESTKLVKCFAVYDRLDFLVQGFGGECKGEQNLIRDESGEVWGRFEFEKDYSSSIFAAILLGFVGLMILGIVTYVIGNKMQQTVDKELGILEGVTSDLNVLAEMLETVDQINEGVSLAHRTSATNLKESKVLSEAYSALVQQISKRDKIIIELGAENARKAIAESSEKIARQVAHDIRSPLTALDLVLDKSINLPEAERLLVHSAVRRINDIANNLLNQYKITKNSRALEEISLQSLVAEIVSEKRRLLLMRSGFELETLAGVGSYIAFVKVNGSEMKRVISNLLNNAIEAIGDKDGKIAIQLASSERKAKLQIIDNGCGIPAELISKLGTPGFSHGKKSGSGLGLAHARAFVEFYGGQISIESTLGKGTVVSIELPLAEPPKWFLSEIILEPNVDIAILDDDESIHLTWENRLSNLSTVQRYHFTRIAEFEEWFMAHGKNVLCLIDYEIIGDPLNGLDIIEKLKISNQSILVTSQSEQAEIQARCLRLDVRMLPKVLAMHVPFKLDPIDLG